VIRPVAAANGFGRHAERLTCAPQQRAYDHRARRARTSSVTAETHDRARSVGQARALAL
jgi:hypothetical protein